MGDQELDKRRTRAALATSGSHWLCATTGLSVLLLATALGAQRTPQRLVSTAARGMLPDAPGAGLQVQPADTLASSITGTVTDVNGGVVPNAAITLENEASGEKRSAVSDDNGFFRFPGIAQGAYTVTLSATGFGSREQHSVVVRPGQDLDLPRMPLPIASSSTDVHVVYSQRQIAEEQVKDEEQQRLLGVIPNFYSSYVWDAEPLSRGEKFRLALKSTIDPVGFIGVGITAGVEQAKNTYPGFGQGAAGYGSRYGALYGDDVTGVFLGRAILPVLFHQDPRYFYKGTGTTRERATYAVTRAFITRGDNGRWQPAYSSLIGNFASGAISNLFLTSKDRNGAGVTISNGFLGIAFNAADSLLREFVWKKVTTGPAAKVRQ